MPVGYSASEAEFNAVNKVGGDKAVTLTTAQIPPHKHLSGHVAAPRGQRGGDQWFLILTKNQNDTTSYNNETTATGDGRAHNNLPPYQVLYMWKRTV